MSQPLPEKSAKENLEVREAPRTSRRPSGQANLQKRSSGVNQAKTSNARVPPSRKKNEALVLKHYRLRALDVQQTEAVAAQRGVDLNDLVRKQYERGVNVDTALGAPTEGGMYGLLTAQRLAVLLRSDIDGLISFALSQGVVPTLIQEYRSILQGLNESLQSQKSPASTSPQETRALTQNTLHQSSSHPATAVSEEADDITAMFFGGSQEPRAERPGD